MTPYRIAACGLGAMVLVLLLLTRFGPRAPDHDTVTVELGFESSRSARARAFDEALLGALERGQFGNELRRRLDHPASIAHLDGFHADACEVRQKDFERFARWRRRNGTPLADPDSITSLSSGHRIAGLLTSPASGVNYAGAGAYCEAAGGRLPWAEEWEALAVGAEGRLYPWGDTFDDRAWPFQDAHRNASQPCNSHPAAATPEGVHDLAGNVMEWSRGHRAAPAKPPRPGVHGAPAVRTHNRALYALNAAWMTIDPHLRSHHLGFRCVYDQPPKTPLPWGAAPDTVAVAAGAYEIGVPRDLRLARVAVLLPKAQQRDARALIGGGRKTRRLTVGRCEVSRADYRVFLRDALVRLGLFANEHEPRGQDYTPQNWDRQLEQPALPVSGVDWWAADAFARWAGGRLPRVEEWQLLAAGPTASPYPWGDRYESGLAATGDQPQPGVRRCGEAAQDRSAHGVNDLAGNVSEWTLSVTAERGDYAAWVQGGNWLLPGNATARTVFGRPVPLTHRSESIGFRVVYD